MVASVVGLWIGARLLVDAVVRLARRFGLSDLTVGLTVVAIGTSTPELTVTTDAALKGLGDIAVANVLGSNIYNLAFVLGVVSLLRVVPTAESFGRRDGVALLGSTLVGGVAVFDLTVTRLEGALLAGLFVAYTAYLLRSGRATVAGTGNASSDGTTSESAATSASPITRNATERATFRGRDLVLLVAGLAVILVSGDYMVRAASALARQAGVSAWVVGGTIVAAGTSTPEFAVSLVAVRQGSLGVSVGNVVGSNIFNFLGVLGVAAAVRPLSLSASALETLGWLVVVSVVMVAALWTGGVLSRTEGALFAGSELVRWVLGLLGLVG